MLKPKVVFYEIHSTGLLPLKSHEFSLLKSSILAGKQIWVDVIGIDSGFIHDLVQNLNLHSSI